MSANHVLSRLCLLACAGCRPAPSTSGPTEAPADVWLEGSLPDDGFGSSLAIGAGAVWIGAPHAEGGRVYRSEDGVLSEVLDGSSLLSGDGRLGLSLAAGTWGLAAGAPLGEAGAGALFDAEGTRLARGESADEATLGSALGTALWGDPTGWVATTATGWRDSAGDSGAAPQRPSAVARWGGATLVGMGRGDTVLYDGSSGATSPRETTGDADGYALLAVDLDGDGRPSWVSGAPAANRVRIWSADLQTLEAELVGPSGSRRFGAALASADWDGDGRLELLIGAPGSGDELEGAVLLYEAEDLSAPSRTWTGPTAGAQLGAAVALTAGCAALGAPGAIDAPGQVLLTAP